MTDIYSPTHSALSPNGSGDIDETPATKDVAKDQAASVGQGAADAGQHVASVAKDQATQVTAEAGRQVKDLLGQAHGQLKEQTGAQQEKLVAGLRSLSDELRSMVKGAEQPGVASDVVGQAADRTGAIAGWLDGREPAAILDDVSSFARRRPGAFLAIAAGLGFVGGRLTRGLQAQSGDNAPDASTPTTPTLAGSPQVSPVPPVAPAPVEYDAPLAVTPQVFPTDGYLGETR